MIISCTKDVESSGEESSDFVDSNIESNVSEDEDDEKDIEQKAVKRWSGLCTRAKLLYSKKKSKRLNWAKVVYSDCG